MAKSYLLGTVGFILFGASSYILLLLGTLFPINILDNLFSSIMFNPQNLSPITELLLSSWTIIWIFLIGIGLFSARKQTKAVFAPFILSIIAIIFVLISSFISVTYFQSKLDSFKFLLFSSIISDNFGPFIFIFCTSLANLLSGGLFAQNFAMILNLLSEFSVAGFFITIAISFFVIENKSFKSGYKIITGIFTLIYGVLLILIELISSFTISNGLFGIPSGGLSLFLIILSGLQIVFFYLLPIFGSMLFILINLDNP